MSEEQGPLILMQLRQHLIQRMSKLIKQTSYSIRIAQALIGYVELHFHL